MHLAVIHDPQSPSVKLCEDLPTACSVLECAGFTQTTATGDCLYFQKGAESRYVTWDRVIERPKIKN